MDIGLGHFTLVPHLPSKASQASKARSSSSQAVPLAWALNSPPSSIRASGNVPHYQPLRSQRPQSHRDHHAPVERLKHRRRAGMFRVNRLGLFFPTKFTPPHIEEHSSKKPVRTLHASSRRAPCSSMVQAPSPKAKSAWPTSTHYPPMQYASTRHRKSETGCSRRSSRTGKPATPSSASCRIRGNLSPIFRDMHSRY